MVAMMLWPTGVVAAALVSSVIWNSVVPPSKIEAWPSTWKVNTGAPITTTRSCPRSASDNCPGAACRKPANCGCRSGNEQRAENGLAQTSALAFSATLTSRSTACARSTAGPTTKAGFLLAASADTSCLMAAGSGPISRLIWRASIGWVMRSQSSIGTETKVGPAGRLHGDIIGARDRRRHVLCSRRLDCEFDIRPREFRGALGIEEWLQRQDRAGLLARGDHQRRLVAIGVVDVAERIAESGRRMQIDEPGIAGGLRIAVGHADHGGFLQAQHIVDVVRPVAQERQFGRAGIAEHFFDAECAQQVESGGLDGGGFGQGRFAGGHQAFPMLLCFSVIASVAKQSIPPQAVRWIASSLRFSQ